MRSVVLLLLAIVGGNAFAPAATSPRVASTRVYGYVPDGFTPAQWKALQEKEAKKKQSKTLGKLGPKGFKSRSFQSFHEALERGEAGHLMPVFNAEEKIRRGELRREDIPYMQRGGSWDNTDIKGAKKKKWLKSDVEYANGGFKKEQSVSIFGNGAGLDWTGTQARAGPESAIGRAPKFAKNYKAPNVSDFKGNSDDKPKKKGFFGMF